MTYLLTDTTCRVSTRVLVGLLWWELHAALEWRTPTSDGTIWKSNGGFKWMHWYASICISIL